MTEFKSPLLGQLTPVLIINKYILICLDQMCLKQRLNSVGYVLNIDSKGLKQ